MKIAIRYYTRTGNTETLAKTLEKVLGVKAETTDIKLEEDVDILFLGSSVYAAGVDDNVKQFIKNIDVKVGIVVNFSTAALLKSTKKQITKLLKLKHIPVSNNEFYCRGSFGLLHKGRPNQTDLDNITIWAKNIIANN